MAKTNSKKVPTVPAKPKKAAKPKAQAKPEAPAPQPASTPAATPDTGRHGIAATLLSGLTFEPSTLETIFGRCGFDPKAHGKYAVANARKAMLALIRAGKADRPAKGLYSLPAALVGKGDGQG